MSGLDRTMLANSSLLVTLNLAHNRPQYEVVAGRGKVEIHHKILTGLPPLVLTVAQAQELSRALPHLIKEAAST